MYKRIVWEEEWAAQHLYVVRSRLCLCEGLEEEWFISGKSVLLESSKLERESALHPHPHFFLKISLSAAIPR